MSSYRAIYYTTSDGTQQTIIQAETWETAVSQIEAQDDFDAWHTQPAQVESPKVEPMTAYQTIVAALQYLAGVCDHAQSLDGMGFNGVDADFGHSLASQTAGGRTLSEAQAAKALTMLRKYKAQLERHGVVLPDNLPAPAAVSNLPVPVSSLPKIEKNNQLITIKFDGKPDAAMLELVKSLPERRWNPDLPGRPWCIPSRYAADVIKAFDDYAEIDPAVIEFAAAPKPAVIPQSAAMRLEYDGKLILVKFPGRPEPIDLEKVKALPERRWLPDEPGKPWAVPTRLLDDLIAAFPQAEISPELVKMAAEQKELSGMSRKATSNFDVPGMKLPLLPFQRVGVEFLEKAGGRAILADEMGLGKTPQSLAYLQLHPELRPAVIVVPASLKINWQREIGKFMSADDRVAILSGTRAYDLDLTGATIFIINYDILADWLDKIIAAHPAIVIMDEAHYAKNSKSQRGKTCQKLAKAAPRVICLTGTPITNRPAELWPLLNMIAPDAWPNFFRFAQTYCNAHSNRYGWDFSGASNLDDLYERIKPWVVRRQKGDVLKELPAKRHATVVVEFDKEQAADYQSVLSGAIQVIRNSEASKNPMNALAEIERAKQAAVYGKLTAAIAWIENFLDTNGKLVVFCTHQFVVDALMDRFNERAVKVTGEVTGENRQKAVDDFQTNDKTRLFVGNVKAAGVGLTLTAASDVAFIEYPWTPGDLTQAIDRTHRIGQTKSVTAWYLVADGTIEEDIVDMLQAKAQIIGQAIDGNAQAMDVNILGELVKRMEKYQKV